MTEGKEVVFFVTEDEGFIKMGCKRTFEGDRNVLYLGGCHR